MNAALLKLLSYTLLQYGLLLQLDTVSYIDNTLHGLKSS